MSIHNLPTITGWDEYEKLVAGYQSLLVQQREAASAASAAEQGEDDARHRDDHARAEALRSGGKDPGTKHLDQWVKTRDAAASHARVLGVAVGQQEDAIQAILRDQRDQALEAAEAQQEAAADAYRDALAGILAAREAFWAARNVTRWLTDGMPQGRRYKAAGAPGLAALASPLIRGGDPLPATMALEAFSNEVDPPMVEPEPEFTYRTEQEFNSAGAVVGESRRRVPVKPDTRVYG